MCACRDLKAPTTDKSLQATLADCQAAVVSLDRARDTSQDAIAAASAVSAQKGTRVILKNSSLPSSRYREEGPGEEGNYALGKTQPLR